MVGVRHRRRVRYSKPRFPESEPRELVHSARKLEGQATPTNDSHELQGSFETAEGLNSELVTFVKLTSDTSKLAIIDKGNDQDVTPTCTATLPLRIENTDAVDEDESSMGLIIAHLRCSLEQHRSLTFKHFASARIDLVESSFDDSLYLRIPGDWKVLDLNEHKQQEGPLNPIYVCLGARLDELLVKSQANPEGGPVSDFLCLALQPRCSQKDAINQYDRMWEWWASKRTSCNFYILPAEIREIILGYCIPVTHRHINSRTCPNGTPLQAFRRVLSRGYRYLMDVCVSLRFEITNVILRKTIWKLRADHRASFRHTISILNVAVSKIVSLHLEPTRVRDLTLMLNDAGPNDLALFRQLPLRRMSITLPVPDETYTDYGFCWLVDARRALASLLPWMIGIPEVKIEGLVPSRFRIAFFAKLSRANQRWSIMSELCGASQEECTAEEEAGRMESESGEGNLDEEDGGVSLRGYDTGARPCNRIKTRTGPPSGRWLGHIDGYDDALRQGRSWAPAECVCIVPCWEEALWLQL